MHTAGNTKSTALKLPLSVLDRARQSFAQHMSSIFPAGLPADTLASNVIQDVNIRLFYDGVAEQHESTHAPKLVMRSIGM